MTRRHHAAWHVIVGLPSLNEADSIAVVAREVDLAIASAPFPVDALLVNADNSSTDQTPDRFLATPTACDKVVVTTPHAAGKGTNWLKVLELAADRDADAVLFVDTDLAAVPESWVHALLGALRDGADYAYPLRPPTWNGGDLTYQIAYPVLAATFGVDLREPLCGDVAISATAVRALLSQDWTSAELRFGVDFLLASLASNGRHAQIPLEVRRRNKLRSFSHDTTGEYRMGSKFAEVTEAVHHRVRLRRGHAAPATFTGDHAQTPVDLSLQVPDHDRDITLLARSTADRLQQDDTSGAFAAFPAPLAAQLTAHTRTGRAHEGLRWDLWRDCLFAWLIAESRTIPPTLLETLFLNRVVGHHSEIAGITDWYATVRRQAFDMFARRHVLWRGP